MSFRRALGLVLVSLLASGAPADALDATFAGRWRVVEAAPAPWARGDQPPALARTGIIFLDGRMLGRGPLTCDNAQYETVLEPPDGLFQGALGADAESAAAALGLHGDTTTLRVTCSTGSYDFHRRGTDLLIGYDNVIYTLRRPERADEPREDAAFVAGHPRALPARPPAPRPSSSSAATSASPARTSRWRASSHACAAS